MQDCAAAGNGGQRCDLWGKRVQAWARGAIGGRQRRPSPTVSEVLHRLTPSTLCKLCLIISVMVTMDEPGTPCAPCESEERGDPMDAATYGLSDQQYRDLADRIERRRVELNRLMIAYQQAQQHGTTAEAEAAYRRYTEAASGGR